MLLIGSRALVENNPVLANTRVCSDWDYIATLDHVMAWIESHKHDLQFAIPRDEGKYYHCRLKDGINYEFELAWGGTTASELLEMYNGRAVAPNEVLYAIKMCHRYKKNSVHFKKTMDDIHYLRGVILRKEERLAYSGWSKRREAESYDYGHPKLNVTSKEFFNADGVDYVYDHDSIHLTVALTHNGDPVLHRRKTFPAYTLYMKDGSEVMTSKEKFMSCEERVRINGVYEEACVLALERSQIPHGLGKEGGPTPRWSFEKALEKVCTSITSGWFREYAWENHRKVMDMYNAIGENDYVDRFKANAHWLKVYQK